MKNLFLFLFLFLFSQFSLANSDIFNDVEFGDSGIKTEIKGNGFNYEIRALGDKQNFSLKSSQKRWFSLGYPRFSSWRNNETFWILQKNVLTLSLEFLQEEDKLRLSEAASLREGTKILPQQILFLTPESIEATLIICQKVFKISIKNFKRRPIFLSFDLPEEVCEKIALDSIKSIKLDLTINFFAVKIAKNSFSMNFSMAEKLDLGKRIFGEGKQEKYVTRTQLQNISQDFFSKIQIKERNDLPEQKFSELFLDTALKNFAEEKNVSPGEAILKLDVFNSPDWKEDVKPDQISKRFERVFLIDKTGEKTSVKVNDEFAKEWEGGRESSSKVGAAFSTLFSASCELVRKNTDRWKSENKNLQEITNEINSDKESDVTWEVVGNKIVPKNIKLLFLSQARFKRDWDFMREKTFQEKIRVPESFSLTYADQILEEAMSPRKASSEKLEKRILELEKRISELEKECKDQKVILEKNENLLDALGRTQTSILNWVRGLGYKIRIDENNNCRITK